MSVSHTHTLGQRRIQSPGRVSIAQNPSARLRNRVLMPPIISFMVVERFEHSDVTAAPDSVARSRFYCPEPFGQTQKSSINAGQRSLLWLPNVSHTQTYWQRPIQSPCRVSIAQNPSARLTDPVLSETNDPFYGCLTFRTLRRSGIAGFSRPVAFSLPRTLRQGSEIRFYCWPTISFMVV